MGKIYRVYVLGETPSDLKERIAVLHAASILKGKGEDILFPNRDLNVHTEKASKRKIKESKNKNKIENGEK